MVLPKATVPPRGVEAQVVHYRGQVLIKLSRPVDLLELTPSMATSMSAEIHNAKREAVLWAKDNVKKL